MISFLLPIALIGATLIVVRGVIFRPLRRLAPTFLGCSQCFGFWVGAVAGAIELISTGHGRVLDALIIGSATSYLAMFADAVFINLLGEPLDDEEPPKEEKT